MVARSVHAPTHSGVTSTSLFEEEMIIRSWEVLLGRLAFLIDLSFCRRVLYRVQLGGSEACTKEGLVKSRRSSDNFVRPEIDKERDLSKLE